MTGVFFFARTEYSAPPDFLTGPDQSFAFGCECSERSPVFDADEDGLSVRSWRVSDLPRLITDRIPGR